MTNLNENKKKTMYVTEAMNGNNNDDYNQELFFISETYDEPDNNSTVSLYLQDDTAYLFCFYGSLFNNINTVEDKSNLPFSNGLFVTVSYKQGISILNGLGYTKKDSDSASFGVCLDDVHQRTLVSVYREEWKRNE